MADRREFGSKVRKQALKRSGLVCEAVGAWYGLPEGYAVVPNDPNRLASLVANIRQGESSTPRCEPPGEYEVDIARGWVVRVLKAASMLAAASGKEGV